MRMNLSNDRDQDVAPERQQQKAVQQVAEKPDNQNWQARPVLNGLGEALVHPSNEACKRKHFALSSAPSGALEKIFRHSIVISIIDRLDSASEIRWRVVSHATWGYRNPFARKARTFSNP